MHLHLIALTRKKIDQIIVSQYILEDPYAITCSEEDNSIREWLKRTDNNNRRVYFKFDEYYSIVSFILYKRILVFSYFVDRNSYCKYLFIHFDAKICFKQ